MPPDLPDPDRPLRIGTRGSPLALAQARETRARLMAAHGLPEAAFEITVIRTTGDRVQDRPLAALGGKGLFTREIEAASAEPRLDLFDSDTLRPLIDLDCEDALAPVVAWHITRQTRILQEPGRDGGTEVFEIAFDEGEIETPGKAIPIAELALATARIPPHQPVPMMPTSICSIVVLLLSLRGGPRGRSAVGPVALSGQSDP